MTCPRQISHLHHQITALWVVHQITASDVVHQVKSPAWLMGSERIPLSFRPFRVSEQLAARSIRDEIFWSLYASLCRQFGNFILAPEALEDGDFNIFSKLMNRFTDSFLLVRSTI